MIIDQEKFTKSQKEVGGKTPAEVAKNYLAQNPTFSAGQVVDDCGISDRYIAHIWASELDCNMGPQYGPYSTV